MKYLSMAALVIMGAIMAGCAKEEPAKLDDTPEVVEPKTEEGKIVSLTISVGLPENESTKALDIDYDKKTAEKHFAAGESIAVIYQSEVYTMKVVSDPLPAGDYGKTASFTVDLIYPNENSPIRIIYPAAMALDVDSDAEYDDDDATINYAALANQDGTLDNLASNLDLCTFDGALSGYEMPTTGSLTNRLAILAYTLYDGKGTADKEDDDDITSSTDGIIFSDGTNSYTISRSTGAGPIYVAIRPTDSANIDLIATEGTKCYSKSLTGKTYAAGQFYNITNRMAEAPGMVNLAGLTGNYVAADGNILIGTLADEYEISIANGATVTLRGVSINANGKWESDWAGITCEGNATIILKDGTTNTVKGFAEAYPGIFVPDGNTLTIQGETAGTGSLIASSNGRSAGIGGGDCILCGNIEIQGGIITATGGMYATGIGSGHSANCGTISITGGIITAWGGIYAAGIGSGYEDGLCGDISITGGDVTARGGDDAAGIGSGSCGYCGDITITNGVTKVKATKGSGATYSIGSGVGGYRGTVTIGGVTGAITTSPYTYEPLPEGALSGKFTINGSGDKVRFSQGNLQWSGTYGWRFAPNQWSYIGENANNDTPTVSDGNYLEFFCWGATGLNGVNPNTEDSYLGGSANLSGNNDWGANAISNGGNKANSGWRTLSTTEWQYLFDSRTNASDKYAGATVNGIHGILLLPDSWTLPDGCAFTAGQGEGWSTNTYDTSQWDSMEASGAVFLPAAGFRYGDWILAVEDNGYYWSSTANNANESNACGLFFYTSGIESNSASVGRENGLSVRLVRDAN